MCDCYTTRRLFYPRNYSQVEHWGSLSGGHVGSPGRTSVECGNQVPSQLFSVLIICTNTTYVKKQKQGELCFSSIWNQIILLPVHCHFCDINVGKLEVTISFEKRSVLENVQVQHRVIIAISLSITNSHYACLLFINSWLQQNRELLGYP